MRLLSYEELKSQKGIDYSKSHLWRLEREGKFPKRIPLGENRHGWDEAEIDEYLEACKAARWEKLGAAAQRVVDKLAD